MSIIQTGRRNVSAEMSPDQVFIAAGRLLDPACYGDDPMDDCYWVARSYLRLVLLCRELDVEMDGVQCPGAAAAILNTLRKVIQE
jgi:hypothetical protein